MPDFQGKVNITDNNGNTRIKLNGDDGYVQVRAPSSEAGVYTSFIASQVWDEDYANFSSRELRIQTANDRYSGPPIRGGAYSHYIVYNGRMSGSLDQPVWHRGSWGRFSAIQFDQSGDIRFWSDGKDDGTDEEAIITPIETMRIDRSGRVLVGSVIEQQARIILDGPTGDIILQNADCAEEFDAEGSEALDPGTVMVIGDQDKLRPCIAAYDKRVAGVISGAGDYKPGIILDRQQSQSPRVPLALLGKVFCKVDASFGPIEVGDLLTTAPTAGHAMKVLDPFKAFGAVIGKALRPLAEGQGLIPMLVGRQ